MARCRHRAPPPSPPPRRPAAPAPALLLFAALLLSFFAPAAAAAPTVVASSALLVLDPQPGDPCSRSPQECGVVDSCASALRVDVLSNGTALITPSGPDYKLECAKQYDGSIYTSSMYSFDPRVPARGTVDVRCSAMTGRGAAEAAWPPAKGGNKKDGGLQSGQRRAIVFDRFVDPDLKATEAGSGKPYGSDGTVSHSLLSGPDSRMTSSALFNRKAFHSALCFPFYCPTPGCFMGRPSALVVIEAPEKGSGRVLVRSAERQFTCDSWRDDYFCGRELSGFSYRVVEGSVLGETAAAGKKDTSCPVGTGPAKITVPPAAVGGGNGGGVKPGPRENVCVSACDGGGKATASASAITYSSAPASCRSCPSGFLPKGATCARCQGWKGPCCSPPTKDCPACSGGADATKTTAQPSVRLRLAAIVAPRPSVTCTDFFRAAAADLASATSSTYLDDDDAKAKAAADCPPRELTLSVNSACGVELSSSSCPMLNTVRPDYWPGPGKLSDGQLGTLPFNLTSGGDGGGGGGEGAAAWAIKRNLVTRYWTGRYSEDDGNSTVAALEPNGPGGRGLLALKLGPVGCVFRYSVVEGSLPGGTAVPSAAAAKGAPLPLPAAAHWCPGNTVKAAEPAKLKSGGEPVPVCVPKA